MYECADNTGVDNNCCLFEWISVRVVYAADATKTADSEAAAAAAAAAAKLRGAGLVSGREVGVGV